MLKQEDDSGKKPKPECRLMVGGSIKAGQICTKPDFDLHAQKEEQKNNWDTGPRSAFKRSKTAESSRGQKRGLLRQLAWDDGSRPVGSY